MIWLWVYLVGAYVTALLDPGEETYRKRRMVWWPITLIVVIVVVVNDALEDK